MLGQARTGLLRQKMLRGYGATAARLTPDQKVGSSNLSVLIFSNQLGHADGTDIMLSNVAPIPLQLGCAMPAPAYACNARRWCQPGH